MFSPYPHFLLDIMTNITTRKQRQPGAAMTGDSHVSVMSCRLRDILKGDF